MASSEDVILQMPEVRYKKGGGTLYVMNKRLAWMFDNKDRVVVSHNFEDVKAQKISPEGKPKVQLQLVLHNGQSSVFHFANKEGIKAQVRDRNKVKDLLATLLPRFKRRVDKELEEKNEFLSKNPRLIQLYCDLVKTNIITSDEFWSHYATSAAASAASAASSSSLLSPGSLSKGLLAEKQDVGVSGAFLADIKPQTDGCNGLKYNITKDIIESIFKTYPAVKKKFKENVPMKLTEAEFWTKFFQSHYFHRDRTNTGANDLFTECEQIDDLQMRKDIESGVDDPNVNLSEFDDNTVNRNSVEPFPSCTISEPALSQNETLAHSSINVCQSMIKHFNQHSIMVLKASKISKKTDVEKMQKIRDKITYEDLMEDNKSKDGQKLHLNTMDGYLVGPSYSNGDLKMRKLDSNHFTKVVLDSLKTNTKNLLTNASAVSVLGELSPGGILMKSVHHHSTENLVSKEIENEIYTLYVSVRELLKQFWSCFPVTSPESQQKLISTNEALHKFHMMKLKPFEEKLLLEFSPIANSLTNHLNQMMNSAYKKFTVWEQRKTKILHR